MLSDCAGTALGKPRLAWSDGRDTKAIRNNSTIHKQQKDYVGKCRPAAKWGRGPGEKENDTHCLFCLGKKFLCYIWSYMQV